MNKTKYKKQLKKAFIAWFEEKAEKIFSKNMKMKVILKN